MYLSLQNTLTAGRVPWPEFARLAKATGFPGTDINNTPAAVAQGVDATKALVKETGLKLACLGLPVDFRSDDAAFDRDFPKLADAAKLAGAVCPRMTTWMLPSAERPKAEQRKIYRDRLMRCADVLSHSGVRLGLEFVSPVHLRKLRPYEFIYRMDEMLEFARECGPNVGVLLDSWHWHHAGSTIADIVTAGAKSIVNVQIADAPKMAPEDIRDNERLMPGEGIIDWTAFFGALKKIGYEHGVSPEVFGRGLKDMTPEAGAKLGFDTSTAVMKKAGVS